MTITCAHKSALALGLSLWHSKREGMEKAVEQTVRVPLKDCVVFTHFATNTPIGQAK